MVYLYKGTKIMANSVMNPKVDECLRKSKNWQEEFAKLRMIILDCNLI